MFAFVNSVLIANTYIPTYSFTYIVNQSVFILLLAMKRCCEHWAAIFIMQLSTKSCLLVVLLLLLILLLAVFALCSTTSICHGNIFLLNVFDQRNWLPWRKVIGCISKEEGNSTNWSSMDWDDQVKNKTRKRKGERQ